MDIDFHYYMTKTLAIYAGFNEQEAQDIAYANQYTDDSVDFRPMFIGNLPKINFGDLLINDNLFDPVTTAHNKQTIIGGVMNTAQLRTYISFHFIPEKVYSGSGNYNYLTKPNGEIARGLMDLAIQEVISSKNDPEKRTIALIKLGIASHSYIDTWAHQNFSGRFSIAENKVTEIEEFENEVWIKKENPTSEFLTNFAGTAIGHAKAGYRPDMAHIIWRYLNPFGRIERNNPEIFMQAAKALFEYLSKAANLDKKWTSELELKVDRCIRYNPPNLTEDNYAKVKPEIYFSTFKNIVIYDYKSEDQIWKNKILGLEYSANPKDDNLISHEYHLAKKEVDALKQIYNLYNYNVDNSVGLRWFYFHIEAQKQREYILKRVKSLPNYSVSPSEIFDNIGYISENNLIPSILKSFSLWNSYRSMFPVPTTITEKHRWIQVTIENRTYYNVIWEEQTIKIGSGAFWEGYKPKSIPALGKITIAAASGTDSFATGVSISILFKLLLNNKNMVPITIAFTHPQESSVKSVVTFSTPKRKCWATFTDNVEKALNDVEEGTKTDEIRVKDDFGDVKFRLLSTPNDKATVVIVQESV